MAFTSLASCESRAAMGGVACGSTFTGLHIESAELDQCLPHSGEDHTASETNTTQEPEHASRQRNLQSQPNCKGPTRVCRVQSLPRGTWPRAISPFRR